MYVCVLKNYHRGKLYKRGDPYCPLDGEKVPPYFKEVASEERLQDEPTPRLGAKVKVKGQEKPSMKAPGKDAAGNE